MIPGSRITISALLVLWTFFSIHTGFAQNGDTDAAPGLDLFFEALELPNGPEGNSVQAMVQDSLGYMWFGSQDGLHRYDGKNFISFYSDPINQNTPISNYIEALYLESNGTLWLTHWSGGGLTEFRPDEETFTRYIHNPNDPESIMPGETGAIAEDTEGNIWIGGRQGLSRLHKETGKFRRYSHNPEDPTSLSNNDVRDLYVDSEGTLWVATGIAWTPDGRGGLNRYNPETDSFERFLHNPENPKSLSNNKVGSIFEDSKGNFWVGTASDGLHLFDRKTKTFEQYPFDPNDSTRPSMPYLEGEETGNTQQYSHITSFFEDDQNRLWISAVYSGLNVYDPEAGMNWHFEAGEGDSDLKSNFIWQAYQSDDGTIWVTTAGEGRAVYKVLENKFRFPYYYFPELRDTATVKRGILEDRNGDIWIAQSPPTPFITPQVSALWKVDKETNAIKKIKLDPNGPSDNLQGFIGSLTTDIAGNIWVGTSVGYFIGNPDTENFQKFLPEVAGPEQWWVAPMFQSSTSDIWLPYWNHGLIRYDSDLENYEVFEYDPTSPGGISGPFVWAILEDADGYIWIGGGDAGGGADNPPFLDRLDPQTRVFEPYIARKLPAGIISKLVQDSNGNFWFIDWNQGFYKLNPNTKDLKRFSASNSLLPGKSINGIAMHPNGQIWLNTPDQLVAFDPLLETFSVYDSYHGVRPVSGSTNIGASTRDGDLLFARWSGFHAFNPDSLLNKAEAKEPDLRITGFKLMDEAMASGIAGQKGNILKKPIWETTEITLGSSENTFAFAVACFDFYRPESNTLQFMLEGYDRGWRSDLRNGETPYYVNVDPGQYTFRIRGSNGLGVWNEAGIQMQVTINRPWWQNGWAYLLYFVVLAFIGYRIHLYQKARTLARAKEEARARELEQAKEIKKAYAELKATQDQLIQSEKMASLGELTAGIAHEIQNPLNFVNNFSDVNRELIEELKEEASKKPKERNWALEQELLTDIDQNLEKISHHGQRADSIVKGMLQHSRNSDGKKEPTDINALADEYLRLAYHGFRAKDKSFNVDMETHFDPKLGEISIVPQDIGRVILNLITNAFHAVQEKRKETGENFKPKVLVSTRTSKNKVQIEVKDNGSGIPEKIIKRIFEPFFTTKPSGRGTGLGLSMSYEIVTKGHGGELKVESANGDGTTFTIELPLNQSEQKKGS
ncbi:two-component regulator propeller domain-containing protein [Robiginitalea sp. IMCC44478]|uniref:two-component regulator propeller domain-containing protein n=1 Tax=Robiginitalea sp. IMCC44478 TaxID=3459122 RepID=UPI004040EAB7